MKTDKNLLKLKKLDAFLKKNDMALSGFDVAIVFYKKDLKDYEYRKFNLAIGRRRHNNKDRYSYINEYSEKLKNYWHINVDKLEHKFKAED